LTSARGKLRFTPSDDLEVNLAVDGASTAVYTTTTYQQEFKLAGNRTPRPQSLVDFYTAPRGGVKHETSATDRDDRVLPEISRS